MQNRLHNNLKMFRVRSNLTQEELAELIGVTRKTVNVIEAGKFFPSVGLALAMAHVLYTTVDELFWLE